MNHIIAAVGGFVIVFAVGYLFIKLQHVRKEIKKLQDRIKALEEPVHFVANFNFTKEDLNKPILDFYRNVTKFSDVGITKEQWYNCDLICYNYREVWNDEIDDSKVQLYGFDNLEHFKDIFIRCNIYNSIQYRDEETLLEDFNWRHKKAMRFRFDDEKSIPSITESGCTNVIDYYKKFSLHMLFAIGW